MYKHKCVLYPSSLPGLDRLGCGVRVWALRTIVYREAAPSRWFVLGCILTMISSLAKPNRNMHRSVTLWCAFKVASWPIVDRQYLNWIVECELSWKSESKIRCQINGVVNLTFLKCIHMIRSPSTSSWQSPGLLVNLQVQSCQKKMVVLLLLKCISLLQFVN
jgi:hypothetical protein